MTISTTPPPPTDAEIREIVRVYLGHAPTIIETLRSGAWSHAYGLDTRHGQFVLRFSKTDEDFRRDAFATRFAGPNLPIPAVVAIDAWRSGWWCLSERVDGGYLDALTADEMRTTLPSLAAMLIAIRDVDASDSHGYGSWDRDGNGSFGSFAEQLLSVKVDDPSRRDTGWRMHLHNHPQEAAIFDRGIELLDSQVQYLAETRALIHMDTLNFNVNVKANRISGIYDWGCAMWGDPVYDLAWFAFWEPWYPQWAELNLAQTLIEDVGILGPYPDERLAACLLHIGLDHIHYNAFTGNHRELVNTAIATDRLIGRYR